MEKTPDYPFANIDNLTSENINVEKINSRNDYLQINDIQIKNNSINLKPYGELDTHTLNSNTADIQNINSYNITIGNNYGTNIDISDGLINMNNGDINDVNTIHTENINTYNLNVNQICGGILQGINIENLNIQDNRLSHDDDIYINGIPIKSTLGYLIKKEFRELLNEYIIKDIAQIVLKYTSF